MPESIEQETERINRGLVERIPSFYRIPIQTRAPEVTRLLHTIRTECEHDGSWNGGDVTSLLCEWFIALGYDIESPLPPEDDDQECGNCGETVEYLSSRGWCDGCEEEADQRECEACGAEPGEECRPGCIGQAAHLDELGIDVTS
jgi:hypothetical protein